MPILTKKIFLEAYEIDAEIGIHDFEQGHTQRIVVDIEIELLDPEVAGGDELAGELDYDFLRDGIAALAGGRRFNLQETLCGEILNLITGHEGVKAATVATRKPDVYPDCQSVGVELSWKRDG